MLDLNRIICGEGADVMSSFPDGCIDLTVTSPPYDGIRTYNDNVDETWGDDIWIPIIEQLYRVTADGGVVVWVVGDQVVKGSETGTSFKQALAFMQAGFRLHDTMIYEKVGPAYPDTVRYYQLFEYMFVFSKGRPKTINLLKDRKNKWAGSWGKSTSRKKDGTLVVTKEEKTKYKEFGIRFNIWRMHNGEGFGTKDKFSKSHPARFPESLARDHIYSWSNVGDTVLDPFCGSGTTLKMARQLERNYIGIDLSAEYCELSERRVLSEK